MSPPGRDELDFDSFVQALSAEFGLEGVEVTAATDLYDELALDSFDAMRLMLWCELVADVLFPPESIPTLIQVQDVFDYYQNLVLERDAD